MTIKQKIAEILDEKNTHHKLSSRLTSYFIIFLILLSVVQMLLETDQRFFQYSRIFQTVEVIIVGIFSIEYVVRLWTVDLIDDKYKGVKGRLSYIFSFYALIDLLAIVPFYFSLVSPSVSLDVFRFARLFRVLRIMRYMKSFDFVIRATKNKKNELLTSFQLIALLTLIFSIMMFYVENKAQSGEFTSIWNAILWSVSKYIGGIGGYGDFTPVTVMGKTLATFIGFLAIALFAVPAGIIAGGFVDEIHEEKERKELSERAKLIEYSFGVNRANMAHTPDIPIRYKKHPILGIPNVLERYCTIAMLQSRLTFSETEIFNAIRHSDNLRIKWEKSSEEVKTFDMIVVEHFEKNTQYGLFERNSSRDGETEDSPVTIICGGGRGERAISHFCRCLARYGKFNLILNEYYSSGDIIPERKLGFDESDLFANGECLNTEGQREFCEDIKEINKTPQLNIVIRSSRANRKHQFQFGFGGEKGDAIDVVKQPTIDNIDEFKNFFNEFQQAVEHRNLPCCTHEEFDCTSKRLVHQWIYDNTHNNTLTIYISVGVLATALKDNNYFYDIKLLSDMINKHFVNKC